MAWRYIKVVLATCPWWLPVLYGCNFQPLLAMHNGPSSVADELASIKVAQIENRSGQVLRTNLVEALSPRGEPREPRYMLFVKIDEPQQNLAFQRNNSVSNVNYGMIAYWYVRDQNGSILLSNQSQSYQEYAISNSQYATGASAQGTRDRIATDISQDIRNKLAQYFSSHRQPN